MAYGENGLSVKLENIEDDYANVCVFDGEITDEDDICIGYGYTVREDVAVHIDLETDEAKVVERWFAYVSPTGNSGMRVGKVNAGYSCMADAAGAIAVHVAERGYPF